VTFRAEQWLAYAGEPVDEQEGAQEQLPTTITLEFLGGTMTGGDRVTVSAVPQFRPGQRVLMFAYEDRRLASPIVGVQQGVWTLDAAGARDEAGDYLQVPSEGRLTRSAAGSGLDEVLGSIRRLLDTGLPTATTQGTADPTTTQGTADPTTTQGTADPTTTQETADPTTTQETAEPATSSDGSGESADEDMDEPRDEGSESVAPPDATEAPRIVVRYSVDEAGGPLLLSAAVESAANAWQSAAPNAVLFERVNEESADAGTAHKIAYGEVGWYGPDALSFTLVRSGSSATEVLVSPVGAAATEAALLHELGVLIGLPEGGDGVMNSAVTPGATEPAAADLAALTALQVFRPEDINRDGVVDFYDLAALAAAFGSQGVNLAADLNGDGVVDEADLEALRLVYKFLPPSETPPR